MKIFSVRGETIAAIDHQQAASIYVERCARRELRRRHFRVDLRARGFLEDGTRFWEGEATPLKDPSVWWHSGDFATREVSR
jgi:hypothetical protein